MLGNAAASSVEPVVTYGGELVFQDNFVDVIVNPTNFGDAPLPLSWDWSKLGLMTTDINQHIPQYWWEIMNKTFRP